MNRSQSIMLTLVLIAIIATHGESAQAQYYGGGFGGGFRGGFGGGGMGSFAPPHSIGGYYPVPNNNIFPGFVGGYPGPYGYGPYGGYGGGMGYMPPPVVVPNLGGGYNPPTPRLSFPIKLSCPRTETDSLSYSLNGTPYTIQPGYSQTFRNDREWRLEFKRGGEESEVVAYTLVPGKYNFRTGANGWDLRQVIEPHGTNDLPPAPEPSPDRPSQQTPVLRSTPQPAT